MKSTPRVSGAGAKAGTAHSASDCRPNHQTQVSTPYMVTNFIEAVCLVEKQFSRRSPAQSAECHQEPEVPPLTFEKATFRLNFQIPPKKHLSICKGSQTNPCRTNDISQKGSTHSVPIHTTLRT